MTDLRERIRELRKAQGWSQAELGEQIGVGRIAISGMEQGDRTISVEEAQDLARVFGISLLALLGATEEEHQEEEGVELRFEVTVKLLPSREEKPSLDEVFEKYPELQRVREESAAIIGASKRGEKVARVPRKATIKGRDAKVGKTTRRTKA